MLNYKKNEKKIWNLGIIIMNVVIFVSLTIAFLNRSTEFTTGDEWNIVLYFMNSVLAMLAMVAVKTYHGISKTKDLYILLLYFINLAVELTVKFGLYCYIYATGYKVFMGSLILRTCLIVLLLFREQFGIKNLIKSNKFNNMMFFCLTTVLIIYDLLNIGNNLEPNSFYQIISIGVIVITVCSVFYNLKQSIKEDEILNSIVSLSFVFIAVKLMYKLDNFLFQTTEKNNIIMEEILMFLALIFLLFGTIVEIYKYTIKYKMIEETNNIYYKIINQHQSINILIYRNRELVYVNEKARKDFADENDTLHDIQMKIKNKMKVPGVNRLREFIDRREDIDMRIDGYGDSKYSVSYQSIVPIHTSDELENINVFMCKNITKEEREKKSVELDGKKFNILNEHLEDAVLITDENLNITYINRVCEEILDKNCNDAVGKDISYYLENIDVENAENLNVRIKGCEKGSELKFQVETLRDYEGVIVAYIFICLNNDKEETSDKEKFENSLLKKDSFTNLSHELRTPIHIIYSSLQLLNSQKEVLSKDEFIESFDRYENIMKVNSLRLLKLVNDIIDISKLDTGVVKLNKGTYNIISLVENISMSVVPYMKVKNIEFIFDTNEEERFIECDQEKIERIVLNLISNAIKFTHENGEIKVFVEVNKEYVNISVKDNGIGIVKEKCEEIFERFAQCENGSITRKGSGIGLSLVKSLVEMHDGYICVDSEFGKGSEFIVCLPNSTDEENERAMLSGENVDMELLGDVSVEFSDIEL